MTWNNIKPPALCGGCRWGQIDKLACYYRSADHDDLTINRIETARHDGTCHAFEAGQPKPKAKPSREEREWAERKALRAERDAAVARAELAEARLAAIVEHIREFSIAAHERYIACDVLKPAHLTLYGAANALDDAASDIRRIATDPKPNRMIIDRAAAVR